MQKEKFLDRSVKSFDFLMESHAYVRNATKLSEDEGVFAEKLNLDSFGEASCY